MRRLPLVSDSNAYLQKKIEKPTLEVLTGDYTKAELLRVCFPGDTIINNANENQGSTVTTESASRAARTDCLFHMYVKFKCAI